MDRRRQSGRGCDGQLSVSSLSSMSRGWLHWLAWSSRGESGGSYSLLPLHDRPSPSGSVSYSSLPLRRPTAFTSHSYPIPYQAAPSHSSHWPHMTAARYGAGLLCCCALATLLGLLALAPSMSGGLALWRMLLPFASLEHVNHAAAAAPAAATADSHTAAPSQSAPESGLSHDDVSLSASFSLSCSSPSQCPFHSLRHLVVVAGHAVLTSLDYHNLTDDSQWALQSFQRSQLSTFMAHIRRGVDIAAADPTALLLFSGGETRPAAGPRSEGQSYWMVAELSHWWQHNIDDSSDPSEGVQWSVRSRTSTEEFARDSYENLLFSICRFHELTQRYPESITVVGFSFKRDRFIQLHARAIDYPLSQLTYIGIDVITQQHNQSEMLEGEMANSYRPFSIDPYGCFPPLFTKRLQRNPFRRSHGYGHSSSCPELVHLLHHCGPSQYDGPALPWQMKH